MAYLPFATGLVGRLAELSALTAQLDDAQAGRGRIVLLSGPPGIGKSRLARELSDLANRRGMTTMWGRNFEGEGSQSFAPWVEALGGYARRVDPVWLQQQLGLHASVVGRIVPAVRDAFTELPEPTTSSAASEDRLGLFDAIVPFVLAVAHERPLLLVLDDLQWADRASLALLRHLARYVADSAMLVVCTFREEEVISGEPLADLLPMVRREAPCQQLILRDLTFAECSALVRAVLAHSSPTQVPAEADDSLLTAVVSRTGGNPFYIQEFVEDLVETGQLQRRRNAWVAASPPAQWDVPREVREVIERRLTRLPPLAQRLLRAACACTAGFSLADAQALTDDAEEALLDGIDAGLRANVLRIVEPAGTPARYDFAHALIRHTLYGALNPDRRARLHLKTAQALERGPVTDDAIAALATHYRLAGRLAAPQHSIDYAVKAGEVAQAGFAYEDAVTHWQTALDLMEIHAVEPGRRAALYEKLGDQLLITDPGDERALASHEKALALYEQAGEVDSATRVNFRIAILFSTIASERQDVPRALRHAHAAAQSMSADDQALRAQIEATYSCACFFSLQLDDALAASQRAMDALAELDVQASSQHHRGLPPEARLDVLRAIVFIHRGFCLAGAGELSAGQALLGEAFDISVRRSLPFFACIASVWGGMVRCDLLDPADARRWFESELAQPRSSRAPVQRQWLAFCNARARLMMGEQADVADELPPGGLFRATLDASRAYLAGDWAECRAAATLGLDVARRRGNPYVECWAIHQLARLALAEDDLVRAEDLLTRSLERLRNQHRPFEALVTADLALLYAGQGRIDEAQAALSQCQASLARDQDWRGLRGRVLLAEAAVAAAELRMIDAHTRFAEATAVFRRYRLPWDEAQALELRGTITIKSGDSRAGDRYLDAAATIYRRHGAGPAWMQRVARARAAAHNGYAPEALLALPEALSHREVEVLRLVAAGRSNQEIADALVLSVRTVERHLGHVYDKLGATGKSARAVATAYGIANGLVPAPAG
jgi:DNA-binding CsgD family transcriptional regulator